MKPIRSIRPILLVLALLAACDSSPAAPAGAEVASITISPASPQAEAGEAVQLSVVIKDAAGNELPERTVFWSSSDSTVASVSSQGLLRGHTPGRAQVAASAQGKSDVVTVVVLPRRVASVVIEPASATLTALTDTVRFTATARDAAGNPLPDRSITWTASEGAVAAISSSGVATAVGNGISTISAQVEGVTGAATLIVAQRVARITVSPASVVLSVGDTVRFSAVALDAKAIRVAGAGVSWGSSNTRVAPVSPSGLVTGASTGQATITASAEGVSGAASITVGLAPVGSVEVTPPAPVLRVGESTTLTAVVRDERGNVLSGRTVTWTSGDTKIITVESTGRVTALAPGKAAVSATSEGKSGTADVTVLTQTAPPVASVTVSPSTASVNIGATVQLSATLRDAAGNVLGDRPVTWTSSNANVATVDGNGLVRGVGGGTATITASAEGKSGSAGVSVIVVRPAVETGGVTDRTLTSATLHGSVDPQGAVAVVWFEWSTQSNLSGAASTAQQTVTHARTVSAALAGLAPDVTYYYRIVASNSGGTSRGDIRSIARALGPPQAPSNLRASPVGRTTVRLTWNDNSGTEEGFHIYRKFQKDNYIDPQWTRVFTVPANVPIWDDTELIPGATYHYYVVAYNVAGESAPTPVVSITLR